MPTTKLAKSLTELVAHVEAERSATRPDPIVALAKARCPKCKPGKACAKHVEDHDDDDDIEDDDES